MADHAMRIMLNDPNTSPMVREEILRDLRFAADRLAACGFKVEIFYRRTWAESGAGYLVEPMTSAEIEERYGAAP